MLSRSRARVVFAAAGLALLGAAPAAAQSEPLPDAAEARAALERACRDDGSEAAECTCLGDFVEKNFTTREVVGAALVLANPLYTSDPGAGIAALLDAGYTLEEITAVAERVIALEDEAAQTCAMEAPPAEAH